MALPSGAHVRIGGVEYRLDEGSEQITGRRCYVHGGRLLDAQTSTILGSSGQNLREDRLLWHITQFAGEGQVVLDTDDPASASRFYRSEGLDFRIPGQGRLNKSALAKAPQISVGGAATTGITL